MFPLWLLMHHLMLQLPTMLQISDSFYMKPWSFLEVIQVYVDFTPGGSQSSHPPQLPIPQWPQPAHRASALVLTQ